MIKYFYIMIALIGFQSVVASTAQADSELNQAFWKACFDEDFVKMNDLIQKGAQTHAGKSVDETPMSNAIGRGKKEVAKYLIEHGDPPDTIYLCKAIELGNNEMINMFLDQKVDVNKVVYNHLLQPNKPICAAIVRGDWDIFKLLIDHGAKVEIFPNAPTTLLHGAAAAGNYDIFKYVFQTQKDLKAIDPEGATILHAACALRGFGKDHAKIVTQLLDAGLDPHVKLSRKSDFWSESGYDTPLLMSCLNSHSDVAMLLLNRSSYEKDELTKALLSASRHCSTEVVKKLIDSGVDVNACCTQYNSPLHNAAKRNNVEMAKLLISAGNPVNHIIKESGQSPLHLAIQSGGKEMVQLLIDSGANLNLKDANGQDGMDLVRDRIARDEINRKYYEKSDPKRLSAMNFDGEAIQQLLESTKQK